MGTLYTNTTNTFQNSSNVPHMLGNQLNPASSMAQKMFDSLHDEVEAHSIYNRTSADPIVKPLETLVGPPFHNKISSSIKEATKTKETTVNGGGSSSSINGVSSLPSLSPASNASYPKNLEELLEIQWEQGGKFLMEQAHHFDIASLLSCLHKLQKENLDLEEQLRQLKSRRDHLLTVNGRLSVPLTKVPTPTLAQSNTSTASLSLTPAATPSTRASLTPTPTHQPQIPSPVQPINSPAPQPPLRSPQQMSTNVVHHQAGAAHLTHLQQHHNQQQQQPQPLPHNHQLHHHQTQQQSHHQQLPPPPPSHHQSAHQPHHQAPPPQQQQLSTTLAHSVPQSYHHQAAAPPPPPPQHNSHNDTHTPPGNQHSSRHMSMYGPPTSMPSTNMRGSHHTSGGGSTMYSGNHHLQSHQSMENGPSPAHQHQNMRSMATLSAVPQNSRHHNTSNMYPTPISNAGVVMRSSDRR